MESTVTKTAVQVTTANRIFRREQGKHSEMPVELADHGRSLWFYWTAAKKVVGKIHCCEYEFFPDHYVVTRNIYNEYGCFWEQKTRHEYK